MASVRAERDIISGLYKRQKFPSSDVCRVQWRRYGWKVNLLVTTTRKLYGVYILSLVKEKLLQGWVGEDHYLKIPWRRLDLWPRALCNIMPCNTCWQAWSALVLINNTRRSTWIYHYKGKSSKGIQNEISDLSRGKRMFGQHLYLIFSTAGYVRFSEDCTVLKITIFNAYLFWQARELWWRRCRENKANSIVMNWLEPESILGRDIYRSKIHINTTNL